MVSHLALKSLIHFKLIVVYGVKGSVSFFPKWSVFSAPFVEEIVFSFLCVLDTLLEG